MVVFKGVSRSRKCEICGKGDWCSYQVDGPIQICRRIAGGLEKKDKWGVVYYVYGLEKIRSRVNRGRRNKNEYY